MTVGELIERLKVYDPSREVIVEPFNIGPPFYITDVGTDYTDYFAENDDRRVVVIYAERAES